MIGGGVVGLAVANALLRAGVEVVSLFPPSPEPGSMASRAAGAMLGAFGEVTSSDDGVAETAFEFRLRAQRLYSEWLDELCDRARTTVFRAKGTYIVANNTDRRDRLNLRLMKRRADDVGEPADYVEPEDVPGLEPSPHHVPGLCLYLPREHSIDADELLAALAASAATFDRWTHTPGSASAVRRDGEGWAVEVSAGHVIRAQQVVVCAGSRSIEVLPPGLRRAARLPQLFFGKGVSCIVSGGPSLNSTIRTPNRAFACGIHVVPRASGLLYLGATNHLGSDHDADCGVQPGELHSMFDQILHQLTTEVRESRIEQLRTGYRPIAAHGRPIIGATNLAGLNVATGTYRDGVLMAPLVGAIVAAGIIGDPDGPANPFPANFEDTSMDPDSLVETGIQDIIAFLHEPRGELPYDRAEELRKYLTALFHMALENNGRYSALRDQIHEELERAPLNETMHKLFRCIVDEAG